MNISQNHQIRGYSKMKDTYKRLLKNPISKVVIITGIIEILCLLCSIIGSQYMIRQYKSIIETDTEVSRQIERIGTSLYRYQSLIYAYQYDPHPYENYEEELKTLTEEITSQMESLGKTRIVGKNANASSTMDEITTNFALLLDENSMQDISLLSKDIKNIIGKLTIFQMYVDTDIAEKNQIIKYMSLSTVIINIIAIICMITAVVKCTALTREYSERIIDLQKKAEAANATKSSFLANMSHEIRTPINAILGMDEMILREAKDKELLEYATDIKRAGNTLLTLINDILDISKIESGKMELIPVDYSIVELINDENIILRTKAEDKGLDFNINLAPEMPQTLHGDNVRIKQIITNIANNAIKYTPKGSVEINVYTIIAPSKSEVSLTIEVNDTGIGIKKEDMPKLFQKFQRIEESRNRNIEGTGIGMSLTKQFVDMMQGKLYVESEYGKGTKFKVVIPQKVIDSTPIGNNALNLDIKTNTAEIIHTVDTNILVVDDNALNRKTITLLLKGTGIHCDTAENGKQCIQLVEENDYDIVFIDHLMPDMDGIETYNLMKQKNIANMPVIMLTANAMSGAKERFLREGFNDFLSKPIDISRLFDIFKKYLPPEKIVGINEQPKQEKTQTIQHDCKYIDMPYAIKNCGNEDNFMELLSDYLLTLKDRIHELCRLINEQDIPGYTIKVHALKSASRTVGFLKMGEIAESAENKGHDNDWNNILFFHRQILSLYKESIGDLQAYVKGHMPTTGQYKTAEINEEPDLITELLKMIEAMNEGEMDKADNIAKHIGKYDWGDYNKIVKEIMIAEKEFDTGRIEKIYQELKA